MVSTICFVCLIIKKIITKKMIFFSVVKQIKKCKRRFEFAGKMIQIIKVVLNSRIHQNALYFILKKTKLFFADDFLLFEITNI